MKYVVKQNGLWGDRAIPRWEPAGEGIFHQIQQHANIMSYQHLTRRDIELAVSSIFENREESNLQQVNTSPLESYGFAIWDASTANITI